MKLVLDTNCLIQCLPRRSEFHPVWISLMDGRNLLCVSNEILEEYSDIIGRLINAEIADYVIGSIINCPFTQFVNPYYHFHLIEVDPDDNKFVDCALAVGARFIVSNDHHYDILKSIDYPIIDVIAIRAFYEKNTMTFMPCRQQQTTK